MRKAQGSKSGKRVGRYTLQERLGGDKVHEAYVAHGESSVVRVRVLRPEVALNAAVVDRFVEAPRSLSGIRHPNLLRVEGVETDDLGIPFVVEELCDGITLKQLLTKERGSLTPARAVELMLPICDALSLAHSREVVHGRIGPDTIMLVGAAGLERPMLTGFGSAHVAMGPSSAPRVDAHYLAPELVKGTEEPDVYSDVWSLGVLLYDLLGGRAAAQLTAQVEAGKRPSLDQGLQAAPAELRALIDACLNADPHARLPSVTILRDRLRALTDSLTPEPEIELGDEPSEPSEPPLATVEPADPDPEVGEASFELELGADDDEPPPVQEVARQRLKAVTVVDTGPDEPELPVLEEPAAPVDEGGVASGIEARTLTAVAAAFASVEEMTEGVGQVELKKKSDQEPEREGRAASKERRRPSDADKPARRKDKDLGAGLLTASARKEAAVAKPATPSPSDLKRRATAPAKGVDAESIERLRKMAKDDREGIGWVRIVLFVLFCLMLAYATPYMTDPDPSRLEAILGRALKPALLSMSILGVGVLIGLWGMKARSNSMLLRSMLWCSKPLAMCIGGVTASWLLPGQGLGPIGFLAHRGLPWLSAGFFFFLLMWALSRGLMQLRGNMLAGLGGLAMAALAGAGGFQAVKGGILEPLRAQLAERQLEEDGEELLDADADAARVEDPTGDKLSEMVGGGVDLSDEAKAIAAEGEGAGQITGRSHAGESEAEDLQGVQALEDSRKATQRQVEMLKNVMPNAAK